VFLSRVVSQEGVPVVYPTGSVEARLLSNDLQALGQVNRWIALALTSPRFWALRPDWPDLHQEILARLIESLREGRFDPDRSLRTYVQGIVRHAAIEVLARRRLERDNGLQGTLRAGDAGSEQRVIQLQVARRVIDLASDDCRELIRCYFFEDLSYGEIAMRRGIPVGTAKSRLFRCLEAAHHFLLGTVPRMGLRSSRVAHVPREHRA
jgi:RNA polymerase sigma factor (sigma-70 family)